MRARTIFLHGIGAIVLMIASFAVTYIARGTDDVSVAQEPPQTPAPDDTPVPGVAPDTTKPYWHIPHVNQDRMRPDFAGSVNGLQIDPESKGRDANEFCSEGSLQAAPPDRYLAMVVEPGPLRIDPRTLRAGITPLTAPEAFTCGDALGQVWWPFSVAKNTPDVNPGGSSLFITRAKGLEAIAHAVPVERWQAATIAGRPAAIAGPIVAVGGKQYGSCFAAVFDVDTNVLTTVLATAGNAEFCTRVAEAVVR